MARNLRVLFSWNGIEYLCDDWTYDGYVAGIGNGALLENHLDVLYWKTENLQESVIISVGDDIEMSISPGGQTQMYDKKTNEPITAVHIDRIPNLVNRAKAKKIFESF